MIPLTFQELTNLVLEKVDVCWKNPAPNDPENWFCFRSNSDNTTYACDGDSGGPVMVMKNNAEGKER